MRRALLSLPSTSSRTPLTFNPILRRNATIASVQPSTPTSPPSFRDEDTTISLEEDEHASHFPKWEEIREMYEQQDEVAEFKRDEEDLVDILSRMEGGTEDITSFEEEDSRTTHIEALLDGRFGRTPSSNPATSTSALSSTDTRPSQRLVKAEPAPLLSPRSSTRPLPDSPIRPYIPPITTTASQPHHYPLLSRYDWRLSSPLIPRKPLDPLRPHTLRPPSLRMKLRKGWADGHNKLLGVGAEPSVENRRWKDMQDEKWGWKVKVPQGEEGTWKSADAHRQGLDRLIALTRESDEKRYLVTLARSGPPALREQWGKTATICMGEWIAEAAMEGRIEQAMSKKNENGEKKNAMLVGVWRKLDGTPLDEKSGYKFTEGAILRFTRENWEEDSSTRPRLPLGQEPDFHRQGHLLEIQDGTLIVGFNEDQAWQMSPEETYRIDFGLDDSSYELQTMAIDNLYFDPARQKQHNATHVAAAQDAFYSGVSSNLREWSLRGTELRELLVPDIGSSSETRIPADEHSPTAEIAHLPSSASLLPKVPLQGELASNPSSLFKDNQLINSWIKRHSRPGRVMRMEGDPELGLNESQTKAVALAMGEKLSLIQGPPGTGKSATIVALIRLLKSHFRIPQPILLAAPTHVSTDHLLSLLVKAGLRPLRAGRLDRIRPDLQDWSVAKRREEHPLWEKCEEARIQSEEARKEVAAFKVKGTGKSVEDAKEATKLDEAYRQAWRRFIFHEQRLYSSLLSTADVFCATAMGSGPSKIMSMVDFPIVFLDEAAMCTEPVTLIPLMKGAEHVSLIGDHKQLPAVVTSDTARRQRLHMSLFERLMAEQTVKSILLDTQYRMRPSISAFPNHQFYTSSLVDADLVSKRPPPPFSSFFVQNEQGQLEPTIFISHDGEETNTKFSTKNDGEIDIIVDIVGDLLHHNRALEASDIGIISPYAAQTYALSKTFEWLAGFRLQSLLGYGRAADVSKVEVNTVDGFQGREKRVIILSTVRSNKAGNIGFLSDQRRLNVALTRAQDALVVVGNQRTLKQASNSEWQESVPESNPGIWSSYLEWLRQRKLVREWKPRVAVEEVQEDLPTKRVNSSVDPHAEETIPAQLEAVVENNRG